MRSRAIFRLVPSRYLWPFTIAIFMAIYVPYGFEHSALEPVNTSHGVTREHAREHAGFLFVLSLKENML